jgi:hypothetical protein
MKQDGENSKLDIDKTKIHDFPGFAHFKERDRQLQKLLECFVHDKPRCNVTDIDDGKQGHLKYIYE